MLKWRANFEEQGLRVIKFNDISLIEMGELTQLYRPILQDSHVSSPNNSATICIYSAPEAGKTTLCEHLLNVPIKEWRFEKDQGFVDRVSGPDGHPRVRTSHISDMGVVVWMDAYGLYMDQVNEDQSFQDRYVPDPNYYRDQFAKNSGESLRGGINIVEHPGYCTVMPQAEHHISLEKQWDDFEDSRRNPSPRNIQFAFTPKVYESQTVQRFVNQTKHLRYSA